MVNDLRTSSSESAAKAATGNPEQGANTRSRSSVFISSMTKVSRQDSAKRPRAGFDHGMDVVDLPASTFPDEVVANLVLSLRFTHQLLGASPATTLACKASCESVLIVKLLTSIPCELVATSKSTAPSSSFVSRARTSQFAHSVVSACENHSRRRAPSSHCDQTTPSFQLVAAGTVDASQERPSSDRLRATARFAF